MKLHESLTRKYQKNDLQLLCFYAMGNAGPVQTIIENEPARFQKQMTSANISQTGNKQRPTAMSTTITCIFQFFIAPFDATQPKELRVG